MWTLRKFPVISAFLFIMLVVNCYFEVFPQSTDFQIKTYSTEHGLCYGTVKTIAQDKYGFLWIGTFAGLSRYDGYEFKNYFYEPSDTTSLAFTQVTKIVVDNSNNVWILGGGGVLQKYNRANDNFEGYNQKVSKTIAHRNWLTITINKDSLLYVFTESGIGTYNEKSDSFYPVLFDEPIRNVNELIPPNCIVDEKGVIWIINQGEIYKYILIRKNDGRLFAKKTNIYLLEAPENSFSLGYSSFSYKSQIFPSNNGDIWLASNIGLYRLDSLSGKFRYYDNPIPKNEFDKNKIILWSTLNNGIYIYDSYNENTLHIESHNKYIIQAYFIDNQNTIWFGNIVKSSGEGIGLNKIIRTESFFKNFLIPTDKDRTKNCAVYAVSKDKYGSIWIGCRDFNNILILKPDGALKKSFSIDKKLKLAAQTPRCFLFDNDENLWVGYSRVLLSKYNLKTHILENYNLRPFIQKEVPYMKSFKRLILDKRNEISIAGLMGICRIDPKQQKVTMSYPDPGYIYSFYMDDNGNYWVGKGGRLLYIDNKGKLLKNFIILNDKFDIECITPTANKMLWIALFGGGICKFNILKETFEFFTTKNGLSHNTTYNILIDKKNNLWISTNDGISKFNPDTKQFWNFGISDGLLIKEFNADAATLSEDGEMIFGGMGGIVRFYPDSIPIKMIQGKGSLLIYDIKVSGFSQHFDSALFEKKFVYLEKGVENFAIYFTCTDLKYADKINYRYRLLGYNNNWITTDNKHRWINYANLKPGTYTCEIAASDIKNEWSRGIQLKIVIPPFYYQTIGFKLFAGLLIILFTVSIIYFYIKQIKLIEKKKQEYLKLESLRNQLNPHFIFNALNPINSYISSLDMLAANQYLTDFSMLLRSFLNNSKHEFISLKDEIKTLEKYLRIEQARFNYKFDFIFKETDILDELDPDIAPSMIQPFIENAIIHGFYNRNKDNKGIIRIQFKEFTDTFIKCIVEDDGVGIKIATERKRNTDKKHESMGISIIKNRLKLYNERYKTKYEINVQDAFPEKSEPGTRITIPIPRKRIK